MAQVNAFPFDAPLARPESRMPLLLPEAFGAPASFDVEVSPCPTVLPAPPRVPSLLSFEGWSVAEGAPPSGAFPLAMVRDPTSLVRPTLLDAPQSKLRAVEPAEAPAGADLRSVA